MPSPTRKMDIASGAELGCEIKLEYWKPMDDFGEWLAIADGILRRKG